MAASVRGWGFSSVGFRPQISYLLRYWASRGEKSAILLPRAAPTPPGSSGGRKVSYPTSPTFGFRRVSAKSLVPYCSCGPRVAKVSYPTPPGSSDSPRQRQRAKSLVPYFPQQRQRAKSLVPYSSQQLRRAKSLVPYFPRQLRRAKSLVPYSPQEFRRKVSYPIPPSSSGGRQVSYPTPPGSSGGRKVSYPTPPGSSGGRKVS